MKQLKSGNKHPAGGGEQKTLADVEDASCILIMGIPTKEWDYIPSPGLVFCQTSSHKFLQMDPNTDEAQEILSQNKPNDNIMCVGDNILAAASEAGIYDIWLLLDNQSTCNTFIYGKYMSNIRYAPGGKYIYVHCNAEVTYTKNIGDLPGT